MDGSANVLDGEAPDSAPAGEAGPTHCSCAEVPPAGFSLVAFRTDQNADCVGDLVKDDRVANPTAGANACTCGACSVTAMPSCLTGNFTLLEDGSNSSAFCNQQQQLAINNGNCVQKQVTLPYHGKVSAAAPSGGSCTTAASIAKQEAAKTTPVRVCAPTATGETCACDAKLAGFATCFRATGDVACPAGTKKALVGTGANVTCDPCGCNLVNPTCSSAKLDYYSDGNCANHEQTMDDNSCDFIPSNNSGSYKYSATAKATCQATAAPAGNVALTGTETICCPQ